MVAGEVGGIVGEWILGMGGDCWVVLGYAGESNLRKTWDNFEWGLGEQGGKGSGWQVELGLRGSERRVAGGSRAVERQQKVTPRRIALFFSTLSALTTRCRLHGRRRQV